MSRKLIERLCRFESHRVPPRRTIASGKRVQRRAENATWNLPATAPNHIWFYDFMSVRSLGFFATSNPASAQKTLMDASS